MLRIPIAFCCLFALGATTLSAQANVRAPYRPGIDVTHYEFRVDFPPVALPESVSVASSIVLRRTEAVDTLRLDLASAMQVRTAAVNGANVTFARDSAGLRIPLPRGSRDSLLVALVYSGRPRDGLIVRRDTIGGYWTAFADHFPDRARQWLATVDHPSDKATVEWIVRAPATHRVIANGDLIEDSPEPVSGSAPAMRLTRWRAIRPLYTAVMVIGVAPFAYYDLGNTGCGLSEHPGCVRQSVWVSPDVRPSLPGPFARAGDMLALYARLVGPFPYEKLAHVQSSTRFGGMENAAAIFYSDRGFRSRTMGEGLVAHETVHQWFGDAITVREWPHVWLSEGFATYFAVLWSEHSRGDSAARADRSRIRDQVLGARVTTEKPVIDTALRDLGQLLNSNVYQKAGFTLHMLRREVGDSAFFRGIRAYYAKHRHGNVVTDDFVREIEAASGGKSLRWFFDQWLRRPGVPDVSVSWRFDSTRRDVMVTVAQSGTGEPYRLALPIDVADSRGRTHRARLVVPAARVATVPLGLRLEGAPVKLTVDPDVDLLARITTK